MATFFSVFLLIFACVDAYSRNQSPTTVNTTTLTTTINTSTTTTTTTSKKTTTSTTATIPTTTTTTTEEPPTTTTETEEPPTTTTETEEPPTTTTTTTENPFVDWATGYGFGSPDEQTTTTTTTTENPFVDWATGYRFGSPDEQTTTTTTTTMEPPTTTTTTAMEPLVDSHDLIFKTFSLTREQLAHIDKLKELHTQDGVLDEGGFMNALMVEDNLAYSLWKNVKEIQQRMQFSWRQAAEFIDYLFDVAKQARNGQIYQPYESNTILCKFNALAQNGKETVYRETRVLYQILAPPPQLTNIF